MEEPDPRAVVVAVVAGDDPLAVPIVVPPGHLLGPSIVVQVVG
jgi:hypothetical protein